MRNFQWLGDSAFYTLKSFKNDNRNSHRLIQTCIYSLYPTKKLAYQSYYKTTNSRNSSYPMEKAICLVFYL